MKRFKYNLVDFLKFCGKKWYMVTAILLSLILAITYSVVKVNFDNHFMTPANKTFFTKNEIYGKKDKTFVLVPYYEFDRNDIFIRELKQLEKDGYANYYLVDVNKYPTFITAFGFDSSLIASQQPQFIIFDIMDIYYHDAVRFQSFDDFKTYALKNNSVLQDKIKSEKEESLSTTQSSVDRITNFNDLVTYFETNGTSDKVKKPCSTWQKTEELGVLYQTYGLYDTETLENQIDWIRANGIPTSEIGSVKTIDEKLAITLSSIAIATDSDDNSQYINVTISVQNLTESDIYINTNNLVFTCYNDETGVATKMVLLPDYVDKNYTATASSSTTLSFRYQYYKEYNAYNLKFSYNDSEDNVLTWTVKRPNNAPQS